MIELDRNITTWTARFQINRKLYICGGRAKINRNQLSIPDLFAIDQEGRSAELAPMRHKRQTLSLSGIPSQLIAIGGFSKETLKICESYFVGINKWSGLPPLNTVHQWPGTILLNPCEPIASAELRDLTRNTGWTQLRSLKKTRIQNGRGSLLTSRYPKHSN